MENDLEHRIREKAYDLWVEEGRLEGKAEYYWHKAKALIEHEDQASIPPTSAPLNNEPSPEMPGRKFGVV